MIRKMLASTAVVAAVGSFAAVGVYSAFSATTQNDNNRIKTGTVVIGDNDSSPLYSVGTTGNGAKPGDFEEHCIKVTYTGTLPSTVKMYRTAITGLGSYVTVTITKGTGDAYNCSDFSGSTSVYNSSLGGFAVDWTGGLALTDAGGSAVWDTNDAVTYKIRGTLDDNNLAQNGDTGTHSFVWEARNN